MRRLWLLSFLVVLAVGQLAVGMRASRTATITGDEPFYLLTTQSLASDGDLDLTDEYRHGEERAFWDGTVPLWKQMEPTPDGRLLAPHDPGLSLLTLPAYELGGLRGVQRFLVVLWAAAMACGAVLARRVGAPEWAAMLGAVVVGAGAPGMVYASQVYPEGPAALCVGVALLLATGERSRPLPMAAALAALAWLGVKYVPMGAIVGVAWAWRFRTDRRALTLAAVPLMVAGGHYLWWHLDTFGGLTPYSTNVVWAGEGTATILDRHLALGGRWYRLYGLFVDARFGLLRWLPAAVLGAWGLRRRTALHGAVLATAVLLGAFVWITIMGWWFPGRPLVAAFPALVTLVAVGAARLPRVAMALCLWSLAIAAAVVWSARTGGIQLAVDPFTLGFPLPPKAAFPDFRHFTAREVLLSLAWAFAIAGGVAIAAQRRRREAARVARGEGARPARSEARTGWGGNPEGQDQRGRAEAPARAP
ncbi:MAG: hypothetical protein M3396_09060 [Actinomycetota bacterium]|nr:hypothetical protein [Actinomycetota bacterium]MDQ3574773.1 hypothetical protein [Actinomycetota bacterium]